MTCRAPLSYIREGQPISPAESSHSSNHPMDNSDQEELKTYEQEASSFAELSKEQLIQELVRMKISSNPPSKAKLTQNSFMSKFK